MQADIRGVFAQVFCDFGPGFTVLDVDGESPHDALYCTTMHVRAHCL